jgi:glyoxylase-like metal-dependent hydrolase (beta-lactamase superfamily II)
LKGALVGALPLWGLPQILKSQQPAGGVRRLTDKLAVVDGGGANVLAFSGGDGIVLVDSGAPKSGDRVMAALHELAGGAKVQTLFNTHYHLDQTGNNELFAAAGAKIIAHERTREWMSSNYWVPAENRYEKARPQGARPTQIFQTTGSLQAADERIDYGYLLLAHTGGDMYVFFKNANVRRWAMSPRRSAIPHWTISPVPGSEPESMQWILY